MRHPIAPVPAAVAAVLLVSGCDSPPASTVNQTEPVAQPTAAPSPAKIAALPEAFRGKWAYSAADCGKKAGSVTIAATELTFSDTRAAAAGIVQTSPKRVTADLAYKYIAKAGGWQTGTALSLQDDGRTLVQENDHPSGRFTYTKCSA